MDATAERQKSRLLAETIAGAVHDLLTIPGPTGVITAFESNAAKAGFRDALTGTIHVVLDVMADEPAASPDAELRQVVDRLTEPPADLAPEGDPNEHRTE